MNAKWSLLVYMATSPRLKPYAAHSLQQLCAATSSDAVDIVVQDDPPGKTKPTRFRVRGGKAVPVPAKEWTYRARTALRDFIDWGLAPSPRSRSALVVWGEGGGWIYPRGLYEAPAHSPLDADLTAAIAGSKRGRVDVLGFDACLMGMVEILYGVRDLCAFQVASETFVPLTGWPYKEMIDLLVQDPTLPARAWAEKIVPMIKTKPKGSATLATYDTKRADAVMGAFKELARELKKVPVVRHAELATARSKMVHVGNPYFVDVTSMLRAVERSVKERGVARAAAKAKKELARANLALADVGDDNAGMSGMSIFFPETKTTFVDDYERLAFAQKTGWGSFLKKYQAKTT